MSTADSKQTTRKQKQKESKSQQHQNATERLKTVVRRLPPNLPEHIFWQSVQPWVTEDTVTWKVYWPGKTHKRANKESIPSRAYIAFKNEESLATFSREYDGHLFRDKAGNESQAIVEFAPFQKIPTEKKKVDARTNTIDKDEDYLSFLEILKNTGKPETVSLEALVAASQPPPPPTTTPLLEALKAEKSAQKDKETILRNHAHYKDLAVSGAASKKEEAKKKAAVAAQAQTQPHPQAQSAKQPEPPTNKKAKKAVAAAATAPQKPPPAGQDGQGAPVKGQPASTASPSAAKPPAPRARPPKEPHGRQHSGKGDASTPAPAAQTKPTPAAPPLLVNTESGAPAPGVPSQAQSQSRKARPVIGLGRHFEAALNGAGVAVGPGERKKRDKGGEPGSTSGGGSGNAASSGKGKEGGGRHREERPSHAPVVPSILQRPESITGSPEVVIMQRPQSPRVAEPTGQGETAPPRGGGPKRGRGRGGRGGNRSG